MTNGRREDLCTGMKYREYHWKTPSGARRTNKLGEGVGKTCVQTGVK